MRTREMDGTARLVVPVFCGVLIVYALDTVLAPYFGKVVPPEIHAHLDKVMGFLEGVLATTGVNALAGNKTSPPTDDKKDPE